MHKPNVCFKIQIWFSKHGFRVDKFGWKTKFGFWKPKFGFWNPNYFPQNPCQSPFIDKIRKSQIWFLKPKCGIQIMNVGFGNKKIQVVMWVIL